MELRLLGPVEALLDGRAVPIRRRQERRLLALLAMRPGQFHSADRLIDLLWESRPPARARAGLQAMISHLRATLDLGGSTEPALVARPNSYALEIATERVDLHRFAALVAGSHDSTDPEQRIAVLSTALGLWRGAALADVFDDAQRMRLFPELDEARLAAREALLEARFAAGQHREMLTPLRELISEHPTRERPVELLMLALAETGRRTDAVAAYAALADRLAADLGVPPGEQITATYRKLGQATAPPDTGPAPGLAGGPAQLPPPPAHFVGRGVETRELDRLLAAAAPPVLVLSAVVGTAGVGKTATAVRWAHRIRDRFPDGQLFVNLRGYSAGRPMRPAEALGALLRGLGVAAARVPADPDEASALYRTVVADRRLLIVLDNALDADQVRPLLPGSARSLVLVTSRDRLTGLVAQHDAHRLTIGLLPEPDAIELLTVLLGDDPRAAERDAVRDLVQECGRLPLAIRIAAALLLDEAELAVSAYVAQLRRRTIAALAIDDDPGVAVQSAFDLSYTRLPADAQRMFRLLGTVPGVALPVEAVAWLAQTSTEAARRTLARLSSAHLVDLDGDRVVLHDLLRRYAAQHSERQGGQREARDVLARLFAWYLVRAQAAGDLLAPGRVRLELPAGLAAEPAGFPDRDAALAWLEAEESNMVALIRTGADGASRADAALLADQLRTYLWVTRNSLHWLLVAQAALHAAGGTTDPALRAAAHMSLGNVHHLTGNHLVAIAHQRRAGQLFRRARHVAGEAAAAGSLGAVFGDLGQLATAAACFEHALRLNRRIGHRYGIAVMSSNLGTVYAMAGRLRLAVERFDAAITIHREDGAQPNEAVILTNLGLARISLGEYPAALADLRAAVRTARAVGMASIEANALTGIGQLHTRLGATAAARSAFATAQRLAERTGDRLCQASIDIAEGWLLLHSGDPVGAAASQARAAEWARSARMTATEAEALVGLAWAVADREPRLARSSVERAITLARQAGAAVVECDAMVALAEVARRQGEHAQAARYAGEAAHRARAVEAPLIRARALITLGHLEPSSGAWREALGLLEALGAPEAAEVRDLLGPQGERAVGVAAG
ncbi:BTAD domain-containing putative transcriptional regulator [Micromonospora sp. NPDC050495]|uniref:AfsR/SARP family transcriptional regulator n=1 Tax=Micromonospora sp. NPDC050495 TaxID=3154936 RepID=UPI0033DEB75C